MIGKGECKAGNKEVGVRGDGPLKNIGGVLVTALHSDGYLEVKATGEQMTPHSEREVFECLGVPYDP